MKQRIFAVVVFLLTASNVWAQQKYDLLLKGGHVIDPKNKISAVRDVAIAGGKVVAVATNINPADAFKVVDVKGLYVTPGLIDIHVHVFAGTGERASYAGDNSVYPDGFTFRVGVTTVADAGCAGCRTVSAHVADQDLSAAGSIECVAATRDAQRWGQPVALGNEHNRVGTNPLEHAGAVAVYVGAQLAALAAQ